MTAQPHATGRSRQENPLLQWFYRGRSIFAKQMAFYLLFILLILGVISFLFFSTARQHLEQEVGRKLQYIAKISASNTPFDRLELIQIGDDQSRMVLRLKEKLAEVQEATGVENIYLFRPDGSTLLDLSSAIRIGQPYPLTHFTPAFLQQLTERPAVNTQSYADAQENIFISAYAPILDLEGRLFAIVGVDSGDGELALIERMRLILYWIAFAGMAFAALLALFFARGITSPIRRIAYTAEQLGSGNYSARAEVETSDELRVLADAINRMAEQVRNRDAALKEMAASVAHEIRNPLNSIKLLVSLLDDDLSAHHTDTTRSTIETLRYEIGKLNRFIEEFLTYARPIALIGDQVTAASLISSVLDMVAAPANEKNIKLDVHISDETIHLTVDRLRLEQTLLNLVLNAVQASQEGGEVAVRTRSAASKDGLDFIVDDSGTGIAPDMLTQIFEPFYTTRIDGTGLGLANAKRIAEAHNGALYAENRPEGGARFVLHLPLQNA